MDVLSLLCRYMNWKLGASANSENGSKPPVLLKKVKGDEDAEMGLDAMDLNSSGSLDQVVDRGVTSI